jgi:methyltransferase-like protein
MGNDLYWKVTPKEPEEELNGVYYNTWYFLQELFGYEEKEDIAGRVLNKSNIPRLKNMAAQNPTNDTLCEDVEELVAAIEKYNSITLVIRG